MRPSAALLLLPIALASPTAAAKDPRLEALLDGAGLEYELDDDGDYKMTVEWDKEKRSQLVYLSGTVEELGSLRLGTLFSPAQNLGQAGIDGARARHLLEQNARTKLGAWEVSGKYVYFSTKFPSSVDAEQFRKLVLVTAETADDLELELSPGKDDL